MNNLILPRVIYTPINTIGHLIINGGVFCHTLEDVVRPKGMAKVHGKTAIPAGRYRVILTYSNRFQRIMPLLVEVPYFEGVRMHGGNTHEDTDGCILVAKNVIDNNTIQKSMERELTAKLSLMSGEIYLEIIDTFPYTGI